MSAKDRPARDAFSFSLRGMSVMSGFVALPVIADDRIRKRSHDTGRKLIEGATDGEPQGLDPREGHCAA